MLAAAKSESGPERTCAGCRQKDAKGALLRFVVRPEEPRLVPDPRRRLPGRGVSVHPRRECVRKAVDKGGFAKALRAKVALSTDAVCDMAASQYQRRIEGLLLAASRNGRVAAGTDAVRQTISDGSIVLLVLAADAAGRRDELAERTEQLHDEGLGLGVVTFGTKQSLGRLLGRAELGALAILDEGIAREVIAAWACVTELSKMGSELPTPQGGTSGAVASAGGTASGTTPTRRNG